MNKLIQSSRIVGVLAACSYLPLAAADVSGTISGNITDKNGNVPPQAALSLYYCLKAETYCSQSRDFVFTDESGHYVFDVSGLPAGKYQVRAPSTQSVSGKKVTELKQENIGVKLDDGVAAIVVDIVRKPSDMQIGSGYPGDGYAPVPLSNPSLVVSEPITNKTKKAITVDFYAQVDVNNASQVGHSAYLVGDAGGSVPQSVTLQPGETQTVSLTVPLADMPVGSYGYVRLYSSSPGLSQLPNGVWDGPSISFTK
jgi:hypothetical protein